MEYFWLCLSAVAAGAVNAVAGGGTLLTFPTLTAIVVAYDVANGTSTVALFPGSFASIWGYRQQQQASKRWLLGGALGARLVEEDTFRKIIPWLILLAAVLFALQPTIARLLKRKPTPVADAPSPPSFPSRKMLAVIVSAQFFIGVYGGYFGAGIGILMLSSLSFLGLKDIHEINALKSFLAFWMNIVAAGLFAARGLVVWEYALAMAVAAIVGGYLGARLALLVPPVFVRWIVIGIGFGLAGYYFLSS